MSVQVKLVSVKANGRRFLYLNEHRGVVEVKGEVRRVSGFAAVHGDSRKFLRDRVSIEEVELTEELLQSLYQESENKMPNESVKPTLPKGRRKWVKWETDWNGKRRAVLTPYADKQLQLEGYDVGMDGLGNYLDEDTLQDAAMDSAAYHCELTAEGVREGHSPCREAAADMIYEGMLRALKERKAAGKSTTLEGR